MIFNLICFSLFQFCMLVGSEGSKALSFNTNHQNYTGLEITTNLPYSKQYQNYLESLQQRSVSVNNDLNQSQTVLSSFVGHQNQQTVNRNDDNDDDQQLGVSNKDSSSYYQDYLSYDQQQAFYACKTTEERINFIDGMSTDGLERRIGRNGESIGHLLLRYKDKQAFEHWLSKGASCSVISGNNAENSEFNNVTILHRLCIKGLDTFPNLLDLIKHVLHKNPSLLSIYNEKGRSASGLIFANSNIDDETTLEIIKEFSKFLDVSPFLVFSSDAIKHLKKLKPKTMSYIFSNKLADKLLFPENREERIKFISNLSDQELDKPVLYNQACIGQILLKSNDIELFKLFLDKGARCTSVTRKDATAIDSEETVLSCLCIKGLDLVPDLIELIEEILDRNSSLLFHLRNGKKSVVFQILNNKNLNDKVTLKILEIFTSRGFNFAADPLICSQYYYNDMISSKPKSVRYIQSCIKDALQL